MREMGGLGKKMPFVRSVFLIGALALAGMPILNGFWSKELILEAGLEGGPSWALCRDAARRRADRALHVPLVWLVFFGEPRSELHAHDAGSAMRIALDPAGGRHLVTWLLAGRSFAGLHGIPPCLSMTLKPIA